MLESLGFAISWGKKQKAKRSLPSAVGLFFDHPNKSKLLTECKN